MGIVFLLVVLVSRQLVRLRADGIRIPLRVTGSCKAPVGLMRLGWLVRGTFRGQGGERGSTPYRLHGDH